MKYLFTIVVILIYFSSFSQESTKRLIEFNAIFIQYADKEQYDSIGIYINNFKKNKDLTNYESQVTFYLEATYNYRINKFEKAITLFEKSKELKTNEPKTIKFYYLANSSIADIYFTKQEYKKAFEYAKMCEGKLSDEIYVDNVNIHSIIGYYYYLNNNFDLSLKSYKKVEQLILANEAENKLSEIYPKIARIYAKKNELKIANQYINKALFYAKKHNYIIDEINVRIARFDIFRDANYFEKALQEQDTINLLNKKVDLNNRNIKFDEVETKYKTKLKEQENNSLKNINNEKEERISQQKWLIVVSFVGLLLVSILAYYTYRLSKKRKETNSIIEKNNAELNRLNLLNQKIFSVISHDFKGPITTLKMMLSNDQITKTENSQVASYIKDINLQLEQSDNMLNSLLDWAKTELNLSITTNEKSKLKTITQEVLLQLQNKVVEKNITINNLVANDEVVFSPQILSIVLRNIISNAIKFSFENGVIDIYLENNALCIKDYGKGIEIKKLEKLFKQSINPGLGTKFETGFGIGLYLSNELMLKNKGSLSGINNSPNGATFSIYFS